MICDNCGTPIRDGARFCAKCGSPVETKEVNHISNSNQGVQLVPAECTACGADLEVDPNQQAAICPYCNNAYIVQNAINKYNVKVDGGISVGSATINVTGHDSSNLLKRAQRFEEQEDFRNALLYYNRVLDMDINNKAAQVGVDRVTETVENHSHFTGSASQGFKNGTLQLRNERLVFITKNKKKDSEDIYIYDINRIDNIATGWTSITFQYGRRAVKFGVYEQSPHRWKEVIENAKREIYPHPNYFF